MSTFYRFPGGLRKAVTLSYDDGVEQDIRLMEILDKHGIRCTFNLNSGCWAKEGTVYAPGTIHRRMPKSQVEKVYANPNHEVAAHCLTHASLTELSPAEGAHEVVADSENLEATEEEITEMIAAIARQNNMTVEQLKPYYNAEFESAIVRHVLTSKVLKLTGDSAVITEK